MVVNEEYKKLERMKKIHRTLNTFLTVGVVVVGLSMINPLIESNGELYDRISGVEKQNVVSSEIEQIAEDEGYRPCPYKDSLGLKTVGYGTLVEGDEDIGCIDGYKAVTLLREHYTIAMESVEKRYPWANEEEKLVLVNLSYNMGETRLAKFSRMLYHLENKEYDLSAGELLNSRYAKQVPNRAGRMAGRIMGIKR